MFKATHIVNGTDMCQGFDAGTPVEQGGERECESSLVMHYYKRADGIMQIIKSTGVDEIGKEVV